VIRKKIKIKRGLCCELDVVGCENNLLGRCLRPVLSVHTPAGLRRGPVSTSITNAKPVLLLTPYIARFTLAYSLLKLFTGLVKAALMVCKTMRKAVMNVSRAMEAMKGRNEISIL